MDVESHAANFPLSKNILDWIKDDAPRDVLPRIFPFCGSRKMGALSRVNHSWNGLVRDKLVWRVVCEDTHKWIVVDDDIVVQYGDPMGTLPLLPFQANKKRFESAKLQQAEDLLGELSGLPVDLGSDPRYLWRVLNGS